MKLKFIALPILIASTLLSCSKSDLNSTKEAEIIVQADVAQTRAGYENGHLPGCFIMDVKQNANGSYDYKAVEMELSDDSYVPTGDLRMVWAGTSYSTVEVKAMTLPFGMTAIDNENTMDIRVSTEQDDQNNILASDLLVADSNNGDIAISDSKIKISFRHLLSKLYITCKFAQDLDGTINSVTLGNICVKGQYSYADMAIPEQCEYEFGDIAMLVQNGQSPAFEALFFPYKPAEPAEYPTLTVNATIAGETRAMTCEITPKKSGFESGKRYTMNVSINATALTPASDTFTIDTEWGDGNGEDDFELDFGSDSDTGDDVFITD